uniref:Leucine-rich repeat-containing protein 28-like isoform X1 n=1 Tax=Crassostrea virginica TaxID=6565 RepID=A0A8B8DZA0_CRAVI|nr:leucine-rich repeat-containing protein 28-like isoform X1 [Crassostrea virginica]
MVDPPSNQMCSIISLNYKGLDELPPSMLNSHLTAQIQQLYMKSNRLTTLPESVHQFLSLKVLYLQNNRIEFLPETIGALKNLELLDVSFNYLDSLPQEIKHLQKLKRLYAFSNRLKELPKSIEDLQNLEVLGVMKNEIYSLPSGIGRLKKLVEMNVDSNHLTGFPRELCNLQCLKELSASNNNLITLPLDLGRIPTLVNVFVDNNPLLNWLPLSLKSTTCKINFGINRCGTDALPEHTGRIYQKVNIRWKNSETSIILPEEISHPMSPVTPEVLSLPLLHGIQRRSPSTDCSGVTINLSQDAKFTFRVPPLLELSLRSCYNQYETNKTMAGNTQIALPRNLEELLHCPTGHCSKCSQVLFESAFPFICQENYSPQRPNDVFQFLGFCCSEQCFYEKLADHVP